jgi:hypothetical protein
VKTTIYQPLQLPNAKIYILDKAELQQKEATVRFMAKKCSLWRKFLDLIKANGDQILATNTPEFKR